MASRGNKKMSLMLINLDPRTHNAYKQLIFKKNHQNEKNQDSQSLLKKTYMEFKQRENQSRYPFGLTEERFKWQNNQNKHRTAGSVELTGHMSKKVQVKGSFDGGFESFYSPEKNVGLSVMESYKTKMNPEKKMNKVVSLKSMEHRRMLECLNSSRVIIPSNDNSFDDCDKKGKKKIIPIHDQNRSLGSIDSLLLKTPSEIPIKGKKRLNASLDNGSVDFMSEEYHTSIEPGVKGKMWVDMGKISSQNGFAGLKSAVYAECYPNKQILRTGIVSGNYKSLRLFTEGFNKNGNSKDTQCSFNKIPTASNRSLMKKPLQNSKNSTISTTILSQKQCVPIRSAQKSKQNVISNRKIR